MENKLPNICIEKFYVNNITPINNLGAFIMDGKFSNKSTNIKHIYSSHNYLKCNGCKDEFKIILEAIETKFKVFPNCCTKHKILLKQDFNKSDFAHLPEEVTHKYFIFKDFILKQLETEIDIQDIKFYFDYTSKSFGQLGIKAPPFGFNEFIFYVNDFFKNILKNKKLAHYKKKINLLLELFENEFYIKNTVQKEVNVDLIKILNFYNNWLSVFPFNLPFFSHLEPKFKSIIPILKDEFITNPYNNLSYAKIITLKDLKLQIELTTEDILSSIDTTILLTKEFISKDQIYNIELLKSSHKISQISNLNKLQKDNKKYMSVLLNWLKKEEIFYFKLKEEFKNHKEKNTKTIPKTFSFDFKNDNNKEKIIEDIITFMRKNKFIEIKSEYNTKKLFNNLPIKTKINWKGNFGDLYSFIKYLNKHKFINQVYIYETASLIFKHNGKDFKGIELEKTKPTNFDDKISNFILKLCLE